jgi:hypothetical protein
MVKFVFLCKNTFGGAGWLVGFFYDKGKWRERERERIRERKDGCGRNVKTFFTLDWILID